MNKKKFTKLLALYLPYLVIGLAATNLGESWRLAEGNELGDKIVSLIDTLLLHLQTLCPVCTHWIFWWASAAVPDCGWRSI